MKQAAWGGGHIGAVVGGERCDLPCTMYSVTMNMGPCLVHTPYRRTKLSCLKALGVGRG